MPDRESFSHHPSSTNEGQWDSPWEKHLKNCHNPRFIRIYFLDLPQSGFGFLHAFPRSFSVGRHSENELIHSAMYSQRTDLPESLSLGMIEVSNKPINWY
jgi:hypothetical protein